MSETQEPKDEDDREMDIADWFCPWMAEKLQYLKDNRHGSPQVLGENCHEKWDEILDEIIFLFNESWEPTGIPKNPYRKEYPQNKEIHEKYWAKEKKITAYKNQCRNKGMALFSKWLPEMWA